MENTKALNDWYEKLLTVSKVPIIETEMRSRGFYDLTKCKHTIHIKTDIRVSEKIKVLLHEYTHYLHFANYYENESRAECEIIANSTAFLVAENKAGDYFIECLSGGTVTIARSCRSKPPIYLTKRHSSFPRIVPA